MSTLTAVAVCCDVTTNAKDVRVARPRPADRTTAQWLPPGRHRLDSTSDPEPHQHRYSETVVQTSDPPAVSPLRSLAPPPTTTTTARPATSAAERPKSLVLPETLTQPRVSTVDGTPDHGPARRVEPTPAAGEADRNAESAATTSAPRGRLTLKVCDVPGSEPRAEPVLNRTNVQTPDSGVAVSPLDVQSAAVQPSAAVNPDVHVLQTGPSGPEYRIAQTPTKSTIVIIRNDSAAVRATGSRANTPSTPSPVRDDQAPAPVFPGLVQPIAEIGATTPGRQPVHAPATTPKFAVADATTTATSPTGGDPGYRSFPSTSSDERTLVRLKGGDADHRRYVITAETLTAVDLDTSKRLRPENNTDQAPRSSKPAEHKSTYVVSTAPARPRNDAELKSDSRQTVVPPPVRSAHTRQPADRIISPTKPKASTPVDKKRDSKVTAAAKQRQPPVQKRAPVNGKEKDSAKPAGQRYSKPKQIVAAKHPETRLRAPVQLAQSDDKQQDSGLQQPMEADLPSNKRSFAELRAMFQAQRS